ncbi:MAG: alanine--tRNA ligase [Ignavibacteriae bacterium]|nr:MAG: alanine--tRNA ligase [Ignavibacteriota bacterium]
MTSSEIRNSFLKYFEDRGHTIISSSPVVPYDDPTLLFTNAGMNQFKDVFLGSGTRSYKRAADTQKCIRVSGKHNDLEEVGRDTYHHTFFEMLGNWSFGDYYKKDAITWAWELLTKVWGLPKDRLWATVYKDDQEAEQLWKSVTDIDPRHVLRFGDKDNFWEMGETGPCGPCSEIHFDRTPAGNATAEMVNAGIPEVMEIWNLVFIQYNRDESGKLTPLPSKHVDTGMGFERICAVTQNKSSNYDTDVFLPIIKKIGEITKQSYSGEMKTLIGDRQSEIDTSMRVIADHVRTLTFAIGDGALPGNEGRGYVLRRILRRAARFGRNLGMHEPFIFQLVPTLVETMSYIFPEIKSNQGHIQKVIKGEEESFNVTLDKGLYYFESIVGYILYNNLKTTTFVGKDTDYSIHDGQLAIAIKEPEKTLRFSKFYNIKEELLRLDFRPIISGVDTFRLKDTFGLPEDLIVLIAKEYGAEVDLLGFEKLMEEQKERSRDNRTSSININIPKMQLSATGKYTPPEKTIFLGYNETKIKSVVVAQNARWFALRETPFYGESGGQVGDTGFITSDGVKYNVIDTKREHDIYLHITQNDLPDLINKIITAEIDLKRRHAIQRNHSATHLLHNALRRILGTHVHQAGSLVAPDYLRFDFAHSAKLTEQELADIEALVNKKIQENIPRTPGLNNIPFEEAKKLGALMFFGDKYGDFVNVVQFGDFSTEFCGGTHVTSTGDIEYFKIRSEGSVASGVRRIEAVTGNGAVELFKLQDKNFIERLENAYKQIDELTALNAELTHIEGHHTEIIHNSLGGFSQRLEELKRVPAFPAHASLDLAIHFDQLSRHSVVLEEIILQLADAKKSLEKELAKSRLNSLSGSMDELIASAVSVENIKLVAAKVTVASLDELKNLGDSIRAKMGSGVGLLASVIDGKVQLVCVVSDDLVAAKKIEAGKVVGTIAKLVGGGGGGRPHMATAGGKDVSKLDEALAQIPSVVESFLRK